MVLQLITLVGSVCTFMAYVVVQLCWTRPLSFVPITLNVIGALTLGYMGIETGMVSYALLNGLWLGTAMRAIYKRVKQGV